MARRAAGALPQVITSVDAAVARFSPAKRSSRSVSETTISRLTKCLRTLRHSHDDDARILIAPAELAELLGRDPSVRLLDVRSREEFEAVRLEGSVLMSQPAVQEIMGRWPRDSGFCHH